MLALDVDECSDSRTGHVTSGESLWYPLNKMISELRNEIEHFGEGKCLLPLPRIEPKLFGRATRS
jgi:hypothetical protein